MELADHGLKPWANIKPSSFKLFLSGVCYSETK
jgi:hypothetical protein